MDPELNKISQLPFHFILCTERTGSSMLTAMLNASPEVLSTSEELFALYFYNRYKNKKRWTENEIDSFIRELQLMSEKSLKMYFSDLNEFRNKLLQYRNDLPYGALIKLLHFYFLDLKDKSRIRVIVDKQIKYLYHLEKVAHVFPHSKFVVLTRDVRDNIVSRKNRKLNSSSNYVYLSGIWNDTYREVPELQKRFPDRVIIVRYEDLVSSPKDALKRICSFIGVAYHDEMLKFHEGFSRFVEAKKGSIGEDFYERLKDFHSGMLEPVNTNKVGTWVNIISQKEAEKIAAVCLETGKSLGYDFSKPYPPAPLNLADRLTVFYARCKRCYLMKFYMALPLFIKLRIKKIRGKPSNVKA